jgi:hypothetical protein
MSDNATGTTVEFGAACLVANAKAYRADKRLVDAAAKYDSLDDAIAALKSTFAVLEAQIVDGGGFTPDRSLGFGSDNCSQIAESILGRRTSLGATRKSFADMGK